MGREAFLNDYRCRCDGDLVAVRFAFTRSEVRSARVDVLRCIVRNVSHNDKGDQIAPDLS